MAALKEKEDNYNRRHSEQHHLSEISAEVAFLLRLMRQNKEKINGTLSCIQERIGAEPKVDLGSAQHIKDRYVTCLLRKNLRRALMNEEIDYLNYFANLDAI
jgi:hypothetical protein